MLLLLNACSSCCSFVFVFDVTVVVTVTVVAAAATEEPCLPPLRDRRVAD